MAWSRQANQASILYQATLTLSLSGKIDYNLLTFKLVLCSRLHNKRIITRQDVWSREDFLKASLGCWVYSYSSLIMIKNLASGNIKMYIVYICHWFFGRGQIHFSFFHMFSFSFTYNWWYRINCLAASCLMQAWLMWNFITFRLRKLREQSVASRKTRSPSKKKAVTKGEQQIPEHIILESQRLSRSNFTIRWY